MKLEEVLVPADKLVRIDGIGETTAKLVEDSIGGVYPTKDCKSDLVEIDGIGSATASKIISGVKELAKDWINNNNETTESEVGMTTINSRKNSIFSKKREAITFSPRDAYNEDTKFNLSGKVLVINDFRYSVGKAIYDRIELCPGNNKDIAGRAFFEYDDRGADAYVDFGIDFNVDNGELDYRVVLSTFIKKKEYKQQLRGLIQAASQHAKKLILKGGDLS